MVIVAFFFFQAEDGIRDGHVTGVQTCALPISDLMAVYRGDVLYFKMDLKGMNDLREKYSGGGLAINFLDEYGFQIHSTTVEKIGRASCRERVKRWEVDG